MGWGQAEIADALDVTSGVVSQRMRRAREGGGPEALRKRSASGAPSRLLQEEQVKIFAWLAEARGFRSGRWTLRRVAAFIECKLCIRYRPGQASKLRPGWGWSSQKPERRARQRDEAAIRQWLPERWPAIRKSGSR